LEYVIRGGLSASIFSRSVPRHPGGGAICQGAGVDSTKVPFSSSFFIYLFLFFLLFFLILFLFLFIYLFI
jgi:hypothetical protein